MEAHYLPLLRLHFLVCKVGLILVGTRIECDNACKGLRAVLSKYEEIKSPRSILIKMGSGTGGVLKADNCPLAPAPHNSLLSQTQSFRDEH